MTCQRIIICVVVLGLFSGELISCQSEIPSFVKICHLSDPDLNNCIKDSIHILKPYLKYGIPALRIPSLEPFPFENLSYDRTGFTTIEMRCTNVYISGGTNFELNNLWFNPESNILEMQLHFPQLDIIADYDLIGSMFFMSFSGNDKLKGTFTDVSVLVFSKLNSYRNSMTGLNHRRLEDIRVTLSVGHGSMNINNIQPNQIVSGTVNAFLNMNWRRLMQKLTPQLEQNLAKMFDIFSNKVFMAFPENVLLPV